MVRLSEGNQDLSSKFWEFCSLLFIYIQKKGLGEIGKADAATEVL